MIDELDQCDHPAYRGVTVALQWEKALGHVLDGQPVPRPALPFTSGRNIPILLAFRLHPELYRRWAR